MGLLTTPSNKVDAPSVVRIVITRCTHPHKTVNNTTCIDVGVGRSNHNSHA